MFQFPVLICMFHAFVAADITGVDVETQSSDIGPPLAPEPPQILPHSVPGAIGNPAGAPESGPGYFISIRILRESIGELVPGKFTGSGS